MLTWKKSGNTVYLYLNERPIGYYMSFNVVQGWNYYLLSMGSEGAYTGPDVTEQEIRAIMELMAASAGYA